LTGGRGTATTNAHTRDLGDSLSEIVVHFEQHARADEDPEESLMSVSGAVEVY